jgi:hypothetical protein
MKVTFPHHNPAVLSLSKPQGSKSKAGGVLKPQHCQLKQVYLMMFYDSKVKDEYSKQKQALITTSNELNDVRQSAIALKANIAKSFFRSKTDEV